MDERTNSDDEHDKQALCPGIRVAMDWEQALCVRVCS
jgi:hypothetical protein